MNQNINGLEKLIIILLNINMSRQSQVNTFNDGLNKDLNPLLTPNNVMTDCLNGTIITYNGNEFALQNDLGNYKFKHGSLDPGFVPVGIKEHANILYIISYNPISDEVEVGSFPSMKTLYKSDINLGDEKEDSITLDDKVWFLYTELSKKSKLVLLSDLTDDNMLNPGDKYILERYYQDIDDKDKAINQTKIEDAWQNRSVYVFTENNKLYNIDEYIDDSFYAERNTYTSDKFKNVNWEIPGWLAVKTDINVMDEFNCYLTNVKYNYDSNTFAWKSTDATIKIQSIWQNKLKNIISDYYIGENDLSIKYNLGYLIYQYSDNDKIEDIDWLKMAESESNITWDWRENNVTNYNDIYSVIYSSIKIEDFSNKYIAIVPVLRVNNDGISNKHDKDEVDSYEDNESLSNYDVDDKFIIYDQFATIIDLSKSDFDKNSVSIGSDIFKYYIGDKSVTINIDVESNSDCDLYYRLLRVPEKTYIGESVNSFEKVYKTWTKLHDFNYTGQNIFDIKFTTEEEYIDFKYNDSSKSGIVLNKIANDVEIDNEYIQPKAKPGNIVNNTFDKEDIYIIQFHVVPKNIIPINNVVEEGVFKEYVMYCSEVSNMYYRIYDNYCSEEFEFGENEFANAIQRQLKVKNIITNNNVDIKTGEYYIAEYINTNGESLSKNINPKDNIDVFIDEMSSLIVAEDSNLQEFNKSVNFKYGSLYSWVFPNGVELIMPKNQYGLTGRLWRNVDLKKSNVNITMYDDQYNSHSLSTKDNKKFDLNIGSLSNVYINPEVISKQGPKESNVFTFDKVANPPVSKLENGWWKLNYITFINKETSKNDHIDFGKVSPNKNIKFKIKSQNRENIYIETMIGDTKYDLYFENGEWNWKRKGGFIVDDKEVQYEFEMWEELSTALFDENGQFDVTEGIDDDDNDWKNQSGLVKELRCPNIVLFYNNIENDDRDWNKFHRIYEDSWSGFEFEYLYNGSEKYIPSEERWFLATNMSLESKYPSNNISFLISPDVNRWHKDRKYSGYINEVFATYFLMVENIKYSKLSGLINKYILNFDANHNHISKTYVNNVEYKINNVTWNYDGLSNIQSPLTYKSVRLYDIQNLISESIFYYEEDVDKYFYNYSNTDFATNIDKYVNKLNNNDEIIKSKNDIYSSPEIHTGDFYLNETYDGMYDLRSLIEIFKYENNRIVLKSDDGNFERTISLRHRNYVRVSKIYDNFYFRE